MSDPYGLTASGLSPELAAQLMGLSREQAVAQALAQQGQAPLEAPQVKGRFQGSIGPMSAIAKVVQAYMGRQALEGGDKKMADLAGRVTTSRNQALTDYQAQRDGTPAQALPQPVANDDEGNVMPPAMKDAVPGNRRAAVANAMLNPMIANNPLVQQDLKKIEPNWAVHKSYVNGRETQVLVNLNDPTETKTFGGTKAPEMKSVTTTDENGRPVTKFVDPMAQTAPLPQPVKKEIVDTGKVKIGVDPYAPTSDLMFGKTTTPGEDLHRQTSLQVAGLDQNGLPSGDVKSVAKMIANYEIPPLSSFAMGHPRGQMIMAEVANQNPAYNAQDYVTSQKAMNDFATGKNGNTVRSISVAVDHLGTLKDAATALNNNDMPAVNKLSQFIAQQTGQQAPVTFDAMKKIVGDEIVKAIVGSGGGVTDRQAAQDTLGRANSPAQLAGVVDGYLKLMGGQLNGLRRQYEQTTRRKDFDRFVSDAAHSQIEGAAPASAAGNKQILDAADAILGGR